MKRLNNISFDSYSFINGIDANKIALAGVVNPMKTDFSKLILYFASLRTEQMGINNDIYASVELLNSALIKLNIKTPGATPNATMSLKLSNCFPYSLSTFNNLAMLPSIESNNMQMNIKKEDITKFRLQLSIIARIPIHKLVRVIICGIFFFII